MGLHHTTRWRLRIVVLPSMTLWYPSLNPVLVPTMNWFQIRVPQRLTLDLWLATITFRNWVCARVSQRRSTMKIHGVCVYSRMGFSTTPWSELTKKTRAILAIAELLFDFTIGVSLISFEFIFAAQLIFFDLPLISAPYCPVFRGQGCRIRAQQPATGRDDKHRLHRGENWVRGWIRQWHCGHRLSSLFFACFNICYYSLKFKQRVFMLFICKLMFLNIYGETVSSSTAG